MLANNIDQWISPLYIYNKVQQVVGDFLKKDVNSNMMLFKIPEGWSEIPCLEMIEVPVTTCNVDVYLCQKLMKSKYPLPSIYSSKFGAIIKQVLSLNYGTEYKFIASAKLWTTTQKREYNIDKYYFIENNYLYIPISKKDTSTPEIVKIDGYFKDKYEVAKFNATQGCQKSKTFCQKPADFELVIPSYLENDVKKEVVNQLLTSLKINSDNYPNLNKNETNDANQR